MKACARDCAAALLLLALAPGAIAQTRTQPAVAPPPPAAGEEAFRLAADRWIARHRPASLVLLAQRDGRLLYRRAERTDASQPTLLGSLSKMITAVCIATLARDGRLDFDAPMRDALSGFLRRNPPPADPRFLDVTVAQLLTHHSGLAGNRDGDPVHRIIAGLARAGEGADPSIQKILAAHLKHGLKRAPGQTYAYSNAGYIALGAVIEDRTKRPYEDYCRDAVMKPLGIESARLHPQWRILSSMGGWMVAPADYLKLAEALSPENPFLGDKVKSWIRAMKGPGAMGGGDWYSLGLITHETPAGLSFSHGGQLNSRGVDAKGRPISAAIRASFARAPDGTMFFAAFTPASYDDRAVNELRSAIGRAAKESSR